MSNKKYCGLCNVWHDPSKEVHQCFVRLDYKCGFNDALEQVAKLHDERVDAAMKRAAISNYRYQQVHDLTVADIHNVSSAHVRSMKKP